MAKNIYDEKEYKNLSDEMLQKAEDQCFQCEDRDEFCLPENCPIGKGNGKYVGDREDGGKINRNINYEE